MKKLTPGAKVRRAVARGIMKVLPWKADVTEWPNKAVIIGAPHTSNLDAAAMILVMWSEGREFNFLVKNNVMKNAVMKKIVIWLGGIGVDRSHSTGLIGNLSRVIAKKSTLSLCITPKGTRSPRGFWKSGFYRIAYENNLPIAFGFVDSVSKTYGVGPHFYPTWDIEKDMETIREYYDGMLGINPEKSSVPRLRAETDPEAAEYLLRPIGHEPVAEK